MNERDGGTAAERTDEPVQGTGGPGAEPKRTPETAGSGPADHSEAAAEGIERATAAVGDDGPGSR